MWTFIECGPWSRWTCELIAPRPHGFFTRKAPQRAPQLLAGALGLTGPASILKQIHSAVVQPAPATPDVEGDALYTQQAGESVWVCSADCAPILIADSNSSLVAAIHAGWRGTAQGVLKHTVAALKERGARSADLQCAIGPAISGRVYQVSEEVAAQVTRMIPEGALALFDDPQPGRVRLDVREVNRQQAVACGIPAGQVALCPVCTFEESEWLYSYRREGAGSVQYSGIGPLSD